MIDRRIFVVAAAAGLAAPALARTDTWDALGVRAAAFDQLHAIQVQVDGEMVLDRVVRGPARDAVRNVKSVSKTLVATLLGAAIDRGEIADTDATIGDLAPRLIPRGADPRVGGITVGHLASMRAGLERTSGGNYGEWISSANWVADALGRDLIAAPGGRMLYSTGSTHILGAVLSEVTGESLLAQARSRIGAPLGVDIPSWTRDPQGRYLGGNQMGLTLEAMMRFGEAWRRDGVRDGQRMISRDWIDAAWTPVARSPWSGMGYGYGWFLGRADGTRLALARGYGGQIIAVLPDRAMTVVIASDPNLPARSEGYFGDLRGLIDAAARLA